MSCSAMSNRFESRATDRAAASIGCLHIAISIAISIIGRIEERAA